MKDYLDVVYDRRRIPKTDYPNRLVGYLLERFGIKPECKILDIGCGRGDFLGAFKNAGLDCYGVDLSDRCSENNLMVEYRDISKEKVPYPDSFFDVVYHKSLLEHFYSPDNLMKETFRVLKPGGLVVILTPDWVSQMKTFYEDFTHCRPYTKDALRDLLEIYGFSNIRTELFYQYPAIWRRPVLKTVSRALQLFISTPTARRLSALTKIKYFRWAVELMVLGYGNK